MRTCHGGRNDEPPVEVSHQRGGTRPSSQRSEVSLGKGEQMRRRAFAINGIGSALIGSTCLITGTAVAQNAAEERPALEEVVVTGIRASLQSSTEAKRESTGFQDSIFAEDIGKFPDTNIAESFNRIPGITITRDIIGEGLNIAIRGLGTELHARPAQQRAGRGRLHGPYGCTEHEP